MQAFIETHAPAIRLGFFLGILVLMALWELAAPRRGSTTSKGVRWLNNLGLVALNTLLLRLLFPTVAVGVAMWAREQGWGLLNYSEIPFWAAVVLTLIAMDFVIWLQHVMVHAIPMLWRLHRVHHADLDYDVTTGARFHPLEIILSMLIKFATILLLGAPVVGVILFEVILNGLAMFNHGNVHLPKTFDRTLRWILVTPDMHRVHHSVEEDEANSNFGFNLSLWDRLGGTYRDQPRAGHQGMTIGIHHYREPRQVTWLPGLLALPFRGPMGDYPINRRHWGPGDE